MGELKRFPAERARPPSRLTEAHLGSTLRIIRAERRRALAEVITQYIPAAAAATFLVIGNIPVAAGFGAFALASFLIDRYTNRRRRDTVD